MTKRECGCEFDRDGSPNVLCADHRPADRVKILHCKTCGETGHNARTCGLTPEQRRANRRGKP